MKINIDEQNKILHQAIDEGVKLSDLLESKHYQYDNLQYSDGLDFNNEECPFEPIELMDNVPLYQDDIPAVSFFSVNQHGTVLSLTTFLSHFQKLCEAYYT